MSDPLPDFETISGDFAFLDDWDERYRYLIDLGGQLPPFPEERRSEDTRVRGCASQVWLTFDQEEGKIYIRGDSDAAIVRGLIAILLSLYSGKTASEINATNAEAALAELDLKDHITPQRSNGVTSMIARIKAQASAD
ncbi:MAG: SufE family protein [Pseudomonadota bacterium]